jgi:hypothetical protein
MRLRLDLAAIVVLFFTSSALAQQRPLVTEDPEVIGAGRILIESGIDFAHDQHYPVSGLSGNLWRIPTVGFSFGISSIAELQIDGGLFNHLSITDRDPNAPLASALTVTGDSTHDVEDAVVGIKIRGFTETANRPSLGIRFATKLPNASNEKGLGLDTTDFFISILGAKTVQSVRIVGNVGVGILTDPTFASRQNDVLTYGMSFARALTTEAEIVGELNGRASTREHGPLPGTESRGIMKFGGRYTPMGSTLRYDAGIFFGLTTFDPTVGFTVGATYVFNAFKVP